MSSTTQNIELIPASDLAQIKALNEYMIVTKKNMGELLDPISAVSKELSKTTINYKALTDAINKYESIMEDADAYQRELIKTQKELEKVKARLAARQTEEGKQVVQIKEQIRQLNLETTRAARENLAAEGSLDKLRAQLIRTTAAYDALSDAARESAEGQQMLKQIQEYQLQVGELEQSTGRFQRNVGNYASAFSPLGFQVQQLARELPSLTNSVQQFFMAISNNLPMLVDELGRAKTANAALSSEGKKGVPVFKQLITSILSWQTALIVGITLVTAYGKEIGNFVKGLFTGKKDVIDFAEALENVNEAMDFDDLGGKIADFNRLVKVYRDLGDNAAAKEKFIKDYREEIDKTGIAVNNINDAENLFVLQTEAYLQSIKLRARAKAGEKLASEQYALAVQEEFDSEEELNRLRRLQAQEQAKLAELNKRYAPSERNSLGYKRQADAIRVIMSDLDEDIRKISDNINSYNKSGDQYLNIVEDDFTRLSELLKKSNLDTLNSDEQNELQKLLELRKKMAEEERKAQFDIMIERVKGNADAIKRIATNELRSYDERMAAFNAYQQEMENSVRLTADNQAESLIQKAMDEAGLNRTQAEERVSYQLALIYMKRDSELADIARDGSEARVEIAKSEADRIIEQIERTAKARRGEIDAEESTGLVGLAKEYERGAITAEQYEQKRKKIARKAAEDRFNADIDTLRRSLEVEGLTAEQRAELEQEIGNARLKYQQYLNEQEIKDAEDKAKAIEEIEKESAQARQEIISGLFQVANELLQSWGELQSAAFERESEESAAHYDAERERIERLNEAGAISKEEAAARKRKVDDDEEVRNREMRQRQARAEKAASVMSILLNTAAAIIKQLATTPLPLGAPFVATIAATGAIQLATAMAVPIPAYAEGTGAEGHKGGWAVVGDGGRPEMIVSPSGHTYKTPSVPTLMNLEKGTIVLPTMPDFSKYRPELLPMPMPTVVTIPEELKNKNDKSRPDRTGELIESSQRLEKAVNKFTYRYEKASRAASNRSITTNRKTTTNKNK